jgi:ribosome-associated protein
VRFLLFHHYVNNHKVWRPKAIFTTNRDGLENPEELKALIEEALDADKAEEIETIDLRGHTAMADFMIVASGRSSRQVSALADRLHDRLRARGLKDIRIEGKAEGNWVIVDAGDIIVHLFRPEVRDFYDIEKMWNSPAFTEKAESAQKRL